MNKQEIIKALAEKTGYTKTQCETFLDGYLNVQKEAFLRGDKFKIVGYGTYEVKVRKGKRGVNPKNPSQKIDIPAKKTVVFSPGKNLKKDLNK